MWGGSRRYLLNRKPIRTLPPMTSLPVFEAVGRHLSVAKAAEELCLTPGAVSRQVRNLESFLACPLFKRAHRRIVFTKAGEQYWSKIHATLGEIRFVTQDISATSDSRPLVIGSPRVFLQKCVLPVLGTLYTNHPEIAVKFVVGGEDDDVMDGAIRVGTGAAPKGYVSEILADGDLCPVCSPSYLRKAPPLADPDDLEHHVLLRSAEFTKNWERWLGPRAARIFSNTRFIDFESSGLELPAAIEGLGIAIVRLTLVKQELMNKQLVVLFESDVVRDHYSFVFHESKLRSNGFRSFRNWLREAVAQ
jgi:LysR family transcriptional regulator, glycine cleavage system transcriptional activator